MSNILNKELKLEMNHEISELNFKSINKSINESLNETNNETNNQTNNVSFNEINNESFNESNIKSSYLDLPAEIVERIFLFTNLLEENLLYKQYFDQVLREAYESLYPSYFSTDYSNYEFQQRSKLWILYWRRYSPHIYKKMVPIFFGKKNGKIFKIIHFLDAEMHLHGIRKKEISISWGSDLIFHWYSLPIEFSNKIILPKSNIMEFVEWVLEEQKRYSLFSPDDESTLPPWSWSVQRLEVDLTIGIDGSFDRIFRGWGSVRRMLNCLKMKKKKSSPKKFIHPWKKNIKNNINNVKNNNSISNAKSNNLNNIKKNRLNDVTNSDKQKGSKHSSIKNEKSFQPTALKGRLNISSNNFKKLPLNQNTDYPSQKDISNYNQEAIHNYLIKNNNLGYLSSDSDEEDSLRIFLRKTKDFLTSDWNDPNSPWKDDQTQLNDNLKLKKQNSMNITDLLPSINDLKERIDGTNSDYSHALTPIHSLASFETHISSSDTFEDFNEYRSFSPMKDETPISERELLTYIRFIHLEKSFWLFRKITHLSLDEDLNGKETISDLVQLCTNLEYLSLTRIRDPSQPLLEALINHSKLKKVELHHCSDILLSTLLQNTNITSITLSFVSFILNSKINSNSKIVSMLNELENTHHLKKIQIYDRSSSSELLNKLCSNTNIQCIAIEQKKIASLPFQKLSSHINTLLLASSDPSNFSDFSSVSNPSITSNYSYVSNEQKIINEESIDKISKIQEPIKGLSSNYLENVRVLILLRVFSNSESLRQFCFQFETLEHHVKFLYISDCLNNSDTMHLLFAQSLKKLIIKSSHINEELSTMIQQKVEKQSLIEKTKQSDMSSTTDTNLKDKLNHNTFSSLNELCIVQIISYPTQTDNSTEFIKKPPKKNSYKLLNKESTEPIKESIEQIKLSSDWTRTEKDITSLVLPFFSNTKKCDNINERDLWHVNYLS